ASKIGKLNLRALRNGGTFLGSVSSEIATSTKPASLWRRHSRSIAGISSRHGGHHVAQKLTRTTLPRCSDNRKLPPSGVGKVKSSASLARPGFIRSSCFSATSTLTLPGRDTVGGPGRVGSTLGAAVTGAADSELGAVAAA